MKLRKFNKQDLEDATNLANFNVQNYKQEIKYEKTFKFECLKNAILNINRKNNNYVKNLKRHWEYENIVRNVVDLEIDVSILEELTTMQKKVLTQFLKYGNLTDVAKELGTNYDTTKAHYRHGIQKLKTILKEEGPWRLLR